MAISYKQNKVRRILSILVIWIVCILMQTSCTTTIPSTNNQKPRVLATTSIIGDVVKQVGGDLVSLTILMPPGADPHEFQPRPSDLLKIDNSEIIFTNGANLESFLPKILIDFKGSKIVEVSQGVSLLELVGSSSQEVDPHTWMDPENVIIWTRNISAALGEFDNKNATIYVSRADDFISKLNELDQWIREQVMQVQTKNRLLVTDHAVLGYFAARYGFTLEGEIIQSFSSDASPTARGLVALEDKIRLMGVKAIFVSETANIKLAEQVAEDLGIRAVRIYHAGIPTSSAVSSAYLELMRYNVSAIVEALK